MTGRKLFAAAVLVAALVRTWVSSPFRSKPKPSTDASVWIVNQYAVSPDMPGITRHVELGTELRNHRWRTRIFATAFHHTTATMVRSVSLRRPSVEGIHDGVRFTWLYSTPYRLNGWKRYVNMLSFTLVFLRNALRGDQSRPAVVVGSSPHLLAPFGAWLVAKRYRVPFVLEVRDVWPDMLVQLGLTNPLVVKPLTWLERFLYKRAVVIVALTDGIADRIAAKSVSRDKIIVIANSSLKPLPLNEEKRTEQRQKLGWDDKVVLVWAGSHNPMNGLDVVVESARILQDNKDILFAFIGDGSLKDQLVEQAAGLPNVRFYDPVPRTEIDTWLRAADIGLMHSRKFDAFEGARPNKLFAYMAAGLPILSTVPGEAWHVVRSAGAGAFAEWENPVALAKEVSHLADCPHKRRAMGQRGFAAVSTIHSREETASRLAALLDACVQSGPGGLSRPVSELVPTQSHRTTQLEVQHATH